MIKKLVGIIVAVAVIAVIVIVVLRRDNFRSMVLRGEQPDAPAAVVVAEPALPAAADSLAAGVRDSI